MYDVIIIGAGPAGLAASLYASERKLKTVVLEAQHPGGQLISLYPGKTIYDFPSYVSITGRELSQKMLEHAQTLGMNLITGATVSAIEKNNSQFKIMIGNNSYVSKSILLACGMGHFQAKRLGVPGENEFINRGVYYQALPRRVTGKRVIVIGGGDTALETAVAAAEKGAAVTIIHRRDTFRAIEKTVEKANSLGIQMYYSSTVVSIRGGENVETVEMSQTGESPSFITADYVVICIGMEINRSFHQKIGVEISNQAVVVNADLQTTVSGIFACGDVTIPLGKYKRISIAVGSAATAINGVYQFLKSA